MVNLTVPYDIVKALVKAGATSAPMFSVDIDGAIVRFAGVGNLMDGCWIVIIGDLKYSRFGDDYSVEYFARLGAFPQYVTRKVTSQKIKQRIEYLIEKAGGLRREHHFIWVQLPSCDKCNALMMPSKQRDGLRIPRTYDEDDDTCEGEPSYCSDKCDPDSFENMRADRVARFADQSTLL